MSDDELNKVELPAIKTLQSLGWTYIEGSQLSPDETNERGSYKDVILELRLNKSIKRINPWISEDNLRKVVSDFTKVQFSNLVEANKSIWNRPYTIDLCYAGCWKRKQRSNCKDYRF